VLEQEQELALGPEWAQVPGQALGPGQALTLQEAVLYRRSRARSARIHPAETGAAAKRDTRPSAGSESRRGSLRHPFPSVEKLPHSSKADDER